MPDLRLGSCSTDALEFTFERVEDTLRLLLVNADESGSMGGRTHENVSAFDKVTAVLGGRADVVILHGFESDSHYEVILTDAARQRLGAPDALVPGTRGAVLPASSAEAVVRVAREALVKHQARGSTNPKSHAAFLGRLQKYLDAAKCEVELAVLNSSDGGFDGGTSSPTTRDIEAAMRLLASRCRCLLAANVLVGTAGSPEALGFFTGDPDRFDNRLLFSTLAAAPGVLRLADFDGASLRLSDGEGDQFTVEPALPCWAVLDGDRLVSWHPEGTRELPRKVTVRKLTPKPGGRRMVMRADVAVRHREVTLDRDGADVFRILARGLSDNPYLRETSRAALNALIAPLEQLLTTRTAVVAMLTASPESQARLHALREAVEANTATLRAAVDDEALSPRERASRCNALNHARHLLKGELREAREALEQAALEKELGFYESHPNHWLVWLQPALDDLKAQLGLTQVDPGDKMAHLSTRIRTAKSTEDGRSRSADRYVDRLLAASRERRDHIARKDDPRDRVAFEAPGVWTRARCPVSRRPLTDGLAAIPFVADRSDLTSGNIMAGGQNVDRMPIDRGPLLSLAAVRDLMWAELGQMASPYTTGTLWYNAAIPVLLGPATPDGMRDLERALGWLATGTSAFAPQMAEALPGALAALLGAPTNEPDVNPQVQALLRTTALLGRYRSYPYAPGTAAFDEAAPKQPLTEVWAKSLDDNAFAACLQSFGCVTSLFARAVAADRADPAAVADDLFSWACRNIARSILGTASTDGRGGVEGVKRFAALLHCAVELDGFGLHAAMLDATLADAPLRDDPGELDEAALAWVLGPALRDRWTGDVPVAVHDFTDALNAHIGALTGEAQGRLIDALDDIFVRLDALLARDHDVRSPKGASLPPPPARVLRSHVGFDDARALESLRPRRFSTPTPGLASPVARIRRMTKASETAWLAPADAGVALNPSALAFLESHTALYPLRAWLRLVDAGLFGQPALAALRASAEVRPIPALPRVLPRLAATLGGMDAVVVLLRRAFAFVVANAHGYADNQWATSPLRTAGAEAVDAVLGAPLAPVATPRHYTASDHLDLSVGADWPRMDADGCLPKGRAIDHEGRTMRPPPQLSGEEAKLSDLLVCQKACAAMLADLAASGETYVIGGLHRQARRVLGEHPVDLRKLTAEERARVIADELVPTLAGRVRGDVGNPQFFTDCANILHQMAALGVDTRTLRAEEPAALIAAEARAIRAVR
jgi:hypothetical protein